jgi:hypothetical protein
VRKKHEEQELGMSPAWPGNPINTGKGPVAAFLVSRPLVATNDLGSSPWVEKNSPPPIQTCSEFCTPNGDGNLKSARLSGIAQGDRYNNTVRSKVIKVEKWEQYPCHVVKKSKAGEVSPYPAGSLVSPYLPYCD